MIKHIAQNKPNGARVDAEYAASFQGALFTFRHMRMHAGAQTLD